MTKTIQHSYGYLPDQKDDRDFIFSSAQATFPAHVDLRGPFMPPVVDQGAAGSCTSNAIAGALGYDQLKQGEKFTPLSRLFIYYNERDMEGTTGSDSGARIRDGIKSVHKIGATPETEWPYDLKKLTVKPPTQAYMDAKRYEALVYRSVSRSLSQLKAAIASGFPVVFGFTVYSSFESDTVTKTGIVPMPAPDEEILGGHAVVAVGYDDSNQHVIVRNSWGASVGNLGYYFFPYRYFTTSGLTSDWWTVSSVK